MVTSSLNTSASEERARAPKVERGRREKQRVEPEYFPIWLGELRVYFDQTRAGDCWNSGKTNQDCVLPPVNKTIKLTLVLETWIQKV